jgi:hypothetical protein
MLQDGEVVYIPAKIQIYQQDAELDILTEDIGSALRLTLRLPKTARELFVDFMSEDSEGILINFEMVLNKETNKELIASLQGIQRSAIRGEAMIVLEEIGLVAGVDFLGSSKSLYK